MTLQQLAKVIVIDPSCDKAIRQKAWDYDNAAIARENADNAVSMFQLAGIECPDRIRTSLQEAIAKENGTAIAFRKVVPQSSRCDL